MKTGNGSKRLPPLDTETVESFAKRIRRKFPKRYDDTPDAELVDSWLEKYPQYKSRFAKENKKQLPTL